MLRPVSHRTGRASFQGDIKMLSSFISPAVAVLITLCAAVPAQAGAQFLASNGKRRAPKLLPVVISLSPTESEGRRQ
jgi:hypothetical protein